MTGKLDPWQVNPTGLISTAIELLHRERDSDNRIAFLLFDVGVETLFKTFLTLPDKITGAETKYEKRKEAAEKNFHELCDGLVLAAGRRLQGINIAYVEHYHDVRNKLYHEGSDITADKVQGYAQISVELLKRLLDVDLSDELHKPERKYSVEEEKEREKREIQEKKSQIEQARDSLAQVAEIAMEKVYPKLVLPSFKVDFKNPQHKDENRGFLDVRVDTELVETALADVEARQDIDWRSTFDLTELYLAILEPIVSAQESSDTLHWLSMYSSASNYPDSAVMAYAVYDEGKNEIVVENAPDHELLLDEGTEHVMKLDEISRRLEEWSKRGDIVPPPIRRTKSKSRTTIQDGRNYTPFLYQRFFADVLERLKQARPGITSVSKTPSANWFSFGAGRTGFYYGWMFRKDNTLWVTLSLGSPDAKVNKSCYDMLAKQKVQIEKEIGNSIFWDRLDDKKQSRIRAVYQVKISDDAERLELAKNWAVETTLKFVDTFRPRIQEL